MHTQGDFCHGNSARIMCRVLDRCDTWNCRIGDFMCPRHHYNRVRVCVRMCAASSDLCPHLSATVDHGRSPPHTRIHPSRHLSVALNGTGVCEVRADRQVPQERRRGQGAGVDSGGRGADAHTLAAPGGGMMMGGGGSRGGG